MTSHRAFALSGKSVQWIGEFLTSPECLASTYNTKKYWLHRCMRLEFGLTSHGVDFDAISLVTHLYVGGETSGTKE